MDYLTAIMAEETIYLCNFRVSVDGDWLCLRELNDVTLESNNNITSPSDDGRYFYIKLVILTWYEFASTDSF